MGAGMRVRHTRGQRKGIALLDACPVPALHLVDMEGLRVLPKGVYPGVIRTPPFA